MDFKQLFPYAAAAGLGYAGYKSRFYKKHGHLATAVGAVGGYLVGRILEDRLFPAAPAQPTAAQMQAAAQQQQMQGMLGFPELADAPVSAAVPPGMSSTAGQHASVYAEEMAERVSRQETGSLGDSSGLGSLSSTPGFSDSDVDALLAEMGGGQNGIGNN
jgi:hypothetical protein